MPTTDGRILADDLQRTKDQPTDLEKAEFRQIQLRRIKALTHGDPPEKDQQDEVLASDAPQHERDLVGLAFSGGGIRSATFGLGLLQGLAQLDILKHEVIQEKISDHYPIKVNYKLKASTQE